MKKGYKNAAKAVKVVNTPTVKLEKEALSTKHEPHLHLTSDNLPELKKWKVGETYTLLLEVKQTGMHMGSYMDSDEDGESKVSADFKVKKVTAK